MNQINNRINNKTEYSTAQYQLDQAKKGQYLVQCHHKWCHLAHLRIKKTSKLKKKKI